jgi:peptide/nickel transport system ATP-binding protein
MEPALRGGANDSAVPAPLLSVRNLSVAFNDGERWIQPLQNVSFDVNPGEVVGIVGESGCGKSLTALSILGLLPRRGCRRSGEMLFEGQDLAALSEGAMRKVRGRRIGMIFQEPMSALDPVFTVGDQIAETVRTHFKVSRQEARERSVEALAAVGIPSPRNCVSMYPMSLSGGMRQRVMIAMALVCEPRLLIADEPTTALDVTIQAQIMDLLIELGQRTGTAILFITHNLGLVAESCARMLTMYAGQVVEDGPVAEILMQPRHPYTAGLLGSVPQPHQRKSRLPSIAGRVPSAHEMPPGCRFAPRCNYMEVPCQQPQDLLARGARHVRCRRQDELTLPGAVA